MRTLFVRCDVSGKDLRALKLPNVRDPIYAQLRLWQPDADGSGSLTTLSEGRVGAIYLGHAETPFSLTTSQNALQGQIAASGICLAETGTVGSVQQVDLAV